MAGNVEQSLPMVVAGHGHSVMRKLELQSFTTGRSQMKH